MTTISEICKKKYAATKLTQ